MTRRNVLDKVFRNGGIAAHCSPSRFGVRNLFRLSIPHAVTFAAEVHTWPSLP